MSQFRFFRTWKQTKSKDKQVAVDACNNLADLSYQKLEERKVLSASFGFVGGLLTIDGFDDVNSDLTIEQGEVDLDGAGPGTPEDAYIFTLGAGTFTEAGGDAGIPTADFDLQGNILSIGTEFFGGGLNANVLIDGAVGADFVDLFQANIADQIEFGSLEVINFQNVESSLELNVTGDVTVSNLSVVDNVAATMPDADLSITTTGSINVNGTLANSIENVDSGISLNATGGNSDVTINDAATTADGSIVIAAGDEVNFTSTGSLTSANAGSISVTANTDASIDGDNSDGIVMADGSFLDAGAGEISLSSTGTDGGDIQISSITTSNATEFAVSINSGLGVIDGGDANSDIVADSAGAVVTIDATAGIGDSNSLEIEVDSIDVENTTVGNIELIEGVSGADINIINLDNGAANGNIEIQTLGGTIVVDATGTGILAAAGTVTLDANGVGSSVLVNNGISTTAGNVSIEADADAEINAPITTSGGTVDIAAENDIDFGVNGSITSDDGQVTISADSDGNGSGAITMTDGVLIEAGAGAISLEASEDITLGGLRTTGSVSVTTNTGAVIDGGDTDTDIVAGTTTIDAATGVGSANALETQVGNIDVDNTTSGNINLIEEAAGGDVDVFNLNNQAAAGDITLLAEDGTITVVATPTGTGIQAIDGTVTLDAQGAGNDVIVDNTITTVDGDVDIDAVDDAEINATITTGGGNVDIDVQDDVRFAATGDITTVGGDVDITADFDADGNGAITMADGALVDAGSGTITFEADEDITLGGLRTTGSVSVTTNTGAVIDGGDIDTDIAAGAATIAAAAGVGSANALETQVGGIDVDNTTSGNIGLIEEAAGGDVDVFNLNNQAAAGDVTLVAEDGTCLLYTSPSPRDLSTSRMPSSA